MQRRGHCVAVSQPPLVVFRRDTIAYHRQEDVHSCIYVQTLLRHGSYPGMNLAKAVLGQTSQVITLILVFIFEMHSPFMVERYL